jgi:hypothetical protein
VPVFSKDEKVRDTAAAINTTYRILDKLVLEALLLVALHVEIEPIGGLQEHRGKSQEAKKVRFFASQK